MVESRNRCQLPRRWQSASKVGRSCGHSRGSSPGRRPPSRFRPARMTEEGGFAGPVHHRGGPAVGRRGGEGDGLRSRIKIADGERVRQGAARVPGLFGRSDDLHAHRLGELLVRDDRPRLSGARVARVHRGSSRNPRSRG